MRFVVFLFLPLLFAEGSFITPMEYASSLYKNPRGIGCNKCHGEKGEGKLIARYIDNTKKKSFRGSKINSINYIKFRKALNKPLNGMPRYYLTKEEIKALFFYLQQMKIDDEK